ncbi:MAG: repeat protein, partial [Verrucomicrobiales bacterium]|nr:repeat protein [Verrucomicrobiales bacterium]
MRQFFLGTFLLCGILSSAQSETATNRFGFRGPEIFPIDNQIGQLHAADINGDGKLDLVLVNNSRAKINLLINRTGNTNAEVSKGIKKEINELPPGARFHIDSIASEKRISALVLTDLNGNGSPDLAYYGEPKELVVQYNNGTNGWAIPKRFPIDDAQLTANALTTGDLNGDKLTDLILLAESYVYFIPQKADHTFGEPEKIPFTGSVKAVQVLDIDGNGKDDLLLVNWDDPNPFRFRLQQDDAQLGAEIYFSLPAIRSYWADDLDGDHKTEIMTISQNSGRAQVANFAQKAADAFGGNFKQGQFQILPFNKTSKARRGILWADVNGDGLADLLVAEPDSGQLTLNLQKHDGSLAAPKTFPTLTGVSEIGVADWDQDGVADIFLLSPDERQIGLTRLDKNGRIAFPTILPFEGRPIAMAVGRLDPKGKPVLATILEQESRRVLAIRSADGKTRIQRLSESFKSNPASMTIHDADQDGAPDLVVLVPYEKMKILRQVPGKDFDEQDIAPPGGNAEQPWLSVLDVDGDGKSELLLAQKNFLRAV